MEALAPSDQNYDFNIFNAAKEIWNGTDFVTEAVADFEDYRVAATKQGDANSDDVDAWFTASIPAGAVAEATSYLMRVRGATLADSYVVAGPALTDTEEQAKIKSGTRLGMTARWRDESDAFFDLTPEDIPE